MKKTFWLLSVLGMATAYSSTAFAAEGRIYVSSKERQLSTTYVTPEISDDELSEAIDRLTANANARESLAFADYDSPSAPAPTVSKSTPLSLGASSAPHIAASAASRAAHGGSIGRCALYVRRALQSAGYSFTPQPSAYQYANGTLASAGFKKIDTNNYQPQIGDVVVFNRTSKNPHGHIQIYDGKDWVSDFRQSKFSPYSQHNGYSVWRDSRYLDDASNQAIYLAFNE